MLAVEQHQWMTLDEVAGHCRVSRRTVNRWISQGLVPVSRPAARGRSAGRSLVRREDVDRLLQECRVQRPA